MPEIKKKPRSKNKKKKKVTESKERALLCAKAALETKAEDPVVLDVTGLASFTDYMVIVSGRSNRQVQAITEKILEAIHGAASRPLGIEGEREARWVLIDWGDVVVNVFYHEERGVYDLEKLWDDGRKVQIPGLEEEG